MKPITKTFIFRTHEFFLSKFMWIIIIFTFVCFTFFSAFSQEPAKVLKGNLLIQTSHNGEPEVILTAHHLFEVEIFKFPFEELSNQPDSIDNVYSIRYYVKNYKDSLDYAKAWLITKDIYDKAIYKWVNDSTVGVKIYNSATHKADTLKLFRLREGSGIEDHALIDFQ